MGDGDLPAAAAIVEDAREEVSTARSRTAGPLWRLASGIPVAGRTTATVRDLVAVAAAAIDVADAVVDRGEALLGPAGQLPLRMTDGQVDLAPLRDARAALGEVSTRRLRETADELRDGGTRWLPAVLVEGRRAALRVADQTIVTVERATAALGALPPFLGGDGPRRYLLAIQTPAELRGTGGLLESYAVLTAEDGRLTLQPTPTEQRRLAADGIALADQNDFRGDPVPAPAAFESRYHSVRGTQRLDRVNVDPDLPTVAPIALDLYEQATGARLDGMVVVDPLALEAVMTAVGPLPVPPGVRDPEGRLPAQIPADRVAEWSLDRIYEVYGVASPDERQAFKESLTTAVFDALLRGDFDTVAVARRLGDAAGRRHLQLWSRDPDEQAAFVELDVAGRLGPTAADHDFLSVTANNAVGTKQDVHVGHRVTGRVELAPPAPSGSGGEDATPLVDRDLRLRTTLVNPLPSSGRDLYVIGNCVFEPVTTPTGCFEGPPGVNRTWFTTWLPEATTVVAETADGALPTPVAQHAIHGLRAFDRTIETPPESENAYELAFRGDAPVRRDGDELVYTLDWWHQSKAVPTHLDLAVEVPDGWEVVAARSSGGGDGVGLGALPTGPRLDATVADDVVRWAGAVTRDAHLEVRFRPPSRPWWGRVRDWLGQPVF